LKSLTRNLFIIPPEECDRKALQLVGGKASSLGELVKAGAPVPPFFTISSTAYQEFIKHNGLTSKINELNEANGEELLKLAAVIRNEMICSSYPQPLEEELRKAYRELARNWGSTAVRSSATFEDTAGASFAGQYETYLGVRTEEDFLKCVKQCYASLYSDRVVTYRQKLGLQQDGVYMAVITQALVKARSAGVMFTVNPVNGDPSIIVIESSWGLGEAVVKGEVIPDKYSINKVTKEVLEVRRSTNKPVKYEMLDNGSVIQISSEDNWPELSLSKEEAVQLANIGEKLEKRFGIPQDIEWAVDSRLEQPNNILIVQSRPVTIQTTVDKRSRQAMMNPLDRIVNTLLTGSKL